MVVLSYGLWQRKFGGNPNIIGSALCPAGHEPYTWLHPQPILRLRPGSGHEFCFPFSSIPTAPIKATPSKLGAAQARCDPGPAMPC